MTIKKSRAAGAGAQGGELAGRPRAVSVSSGNRSRPPQTTSATPMIASPAICSIGMKTTATGGAS